MTVDRIELAKSIHAVLDAHNNDPWDAASARSERLGLKGNDGGAYFNTNQTVALKAADVAIVAHARRIDELLDANNGYLERARAAERAALAPAQLRYVLKMMPGGSGGGSTRMLGADDLTGEGVLALREKLKAQLA